MAVKKIRKIANWILWAVSATSIAVFVLFFFGGDAENSPYADTQLWDPKYMDSLIYWIYIMFGLAIGALVGFGVFSFSTSLKAKPKAALASLGALIGFGAILVIAYALGDATPLPNINADSQQFNVPFWLKLTDMWIYSLYIMFTLCTLSMLGGAFFKFFNK